MKRAFALVVATLIGVVGVESAPPKVEVVLAKDQETKPTDTFKADVPKLYAFFRSTGTKKGDVLRGVWVADDVGEAAPKGTKIDEATVTLDRDDGFGAFSLTKPTAGWPVGKYHVDVYLADKVAATAKFTITPATSDSDEETENEDGESEEE